MKPESLGRVRLSLDPDRQDEVDTTIPSQKIFDDIVRAVLQYVRLTEDEHVRVAVTQDDCTGASVADCFELTELAL